MPKYRVILESDENLTDQEILMKAQHLLAMYNGEDDVIANFSLVEAINLEGMKGEEDEIQGDIHS